MDCLQRFGEGKVISPALKGERSRMHWHTEGSRSIPGLKFGRDRKRKGMDAERGLENG